MRVTHPAPTLESATLPRCLNRLVDLYGHKIATIYRDEALKEDDVLELDGQRWKVFSQVGASARVTRL
jgi:hypothetical protein